MFVFLRAVGFALLCQLPGSFLVEAVSDCCEFAVSEHFLLCPFFRSVHAVC